MHYSLQLTAAVATIGYLSCVPQQQTDTEALGYLAENPYDDFMYKYLLGRVLQMDFAAAADFAARFQTSPVAKTLLAEAALQRRELENLVAPAVSYAASPLVDLRQEEFADMSVHRTWSRLLAKNLLQHMPLPAMESWPAVPYTEETIACAAAGFVPVTRFIDQVTETGNYGSSSEEAIQRGEEALAAAGVELQPQMLHQSSLAPAGLVRNWRLSVSVNIGGLNYSVDGEQTSFGRGLVSDEAKAGLIMEICERFSSWANISDGRALGYLESLPLVHSRYSELSADALNPAELPLEVPDGDIPLYWLPAEYPDGSSLLVPAQFVFLFANFPEAGICSSVGSTGLGAGLDMARAKVTALLEVVERDAESVMPFNAARCFRIESRQPVLAELLEKYASRGIDLFFEDITSGLGVPCYRAFAIGPEGQVIKGASAGLNGADACVSAMLEVPYPYPWGPPTRPAPAGLPVRLVEELPDYSTGGFTGDLFLLESALTASGRKPVCINLTRKDMGIPVCRALIPGMELMADFDRNSRLSPRLFANLFADMAQA